MLTGCLPSRMKGAPAGLTRRPQMSDEMRSELCQSGPLSITTTFLPALASTAAKTPPDAPAPTMTASTFSCVAMPSSPFPFGQDMRQVRDPDPLETLHGAVDDIDGVVAKRPIDRRLRCLAVPALELAATQMRDEFELLGL